MDQKGAERKGGEFKIRNERDFVRAVAPHANVTTDVVASVGVEIDGAPVSVVYDTLRGTLGVGGDVARDLAIEFSIHPPKIGPDHIIGGEG